ncbi:DUF4097 family beta strand repeat-containing protein [Brachybacterium sp. DNPG3]
MSTDLHPSPAPRPAPLPASASLPAPAPATADDRRGVDIDPARRLSPGPGRGNGWRVATVVIAVVVSALAVVSLVASTVVPWAIGRSYRVIPATLALGTPSSLTLDVDVADVRIVRDAEADEVTVALVADGATRLPETEESVRATMRDDGTASAPDLTIRQPVRTGPIPWVHDARDVLVVVPADLALDLDLTSDLGNVEAEGPFGSLLVVSSLGDVDLTGVSTTGIVDVSADMGSIRADIDGGRAADIALRSSLGDVDLVVEEGTSGAIEAYADTGSMTVQVPGDARWEIDAQADMGDVDVDRSITGADGASAGTMTLTTDLGDIRVTR